MTKFEDLSVREMIYRRTHKYAVTLGRKLYKAANLDLAYGEKESLEPVEGLAEANLVSSRLPNGMHAPVIDLDGPHNLVPSSTQGHSHLYLDTPMTWRRYKLLLRALWKAGVIEEGFYRNSVRRGFSSVRPPGVFKDDHLW